MDALRRHGPQACGVYALGRQIGERPQHKGALKHAGVWHHQVRRVDHLVAKPQDIEVQRARRVGIRALAPGGRLNRLQGLEQRMGCEAGGQLGHGIEVIGATRVHRGAAVQR